MLIGIRKEGRVGMGAVFGMGEEYVKVRAEVHVSRQAQHAVRGLFHLSFCPVHPVCLVLSQLAKKCSLETEVW